MADDEDEQLPGLIPTRSDMLGWPTVLFAGLVVAGLVLLLLAGRPLGTLAMLLTGALAAALVIGLVAGRGRLQVNVSLVELLAWPVVGLLAGALDEGDAATAVAVFLFYPSSLYAWRIVLGRSWLTR